MKKLLPILLLSVCAISCKKEAESQAPTTDPTARYMRFTVDGKSYDWSTITVEETNVGVAYTQLFVQGTSVDGSERVTILFHKPVAEPWTTTASTYKQMSVQTLSRAALTVGGKGTLTYDAATKTFKGTFTSQGGDASLDKGTFQVGF